MESSMMYVWIAMYVNCVGCYYMEKNASCVKVRKRKIVSRAYVRAYQKCNSNDENGRESDGTHDGLQIFRKLTTCRFCRRESIDQQFITLFYI